jgi:hypothetical protein
LLNSFRSVTREIKADTTQIKDKTEDIHNDTQRILEEIARLKARLPQTETQVEGRGFVLERYLDALSSYAGAVVGDDLSSEHDGEGSFNT